MNINIENQKPDIKISVRQTFNLDTDMEVMGFSKKNLKLIFQIKIKIFQIKKYLKMMKV